MNSTYIFENGVYLKSSAAIVGPIEGKGKLTDYYDKIFKDNYCEEKNWEQAEQRLLTEAIDTAIKKANLTKDQIELILAGDLINQNVISNYVLREYNIPFLGMYGACSTSMQTLLTAALLVNSKKFNNVIAATSSHNSTAERQYRYPTEYGVKRPQTATYTVTGGGASVVSSDISKIKIVSATIGKVIDAKQNDPNDLGSAMAPAASDTILKHLKDLNLPSNHYDLILTGDLSKIGSNILVDIMNYENFDISSNHDDCGKIIYNEDQKVFSGGSGCACCAVVTYGYIRHLLEIGKLNRVLVVATGALLNPVMTLQNETIPCIAHAVALESCK